MATVPSIDTGRTGLSSSGSAPVTGAPLGRDVPIRTGTSGLTHTGAPDGIHKALGGVITHGAIRAAQGIPTPHGGRPHKALVSPKSKPGKAVPKPVKVTSTHHAKGKPATGHKAPVTRPKPKPKVTTKAPKATAHKAPKSAGVSTPTNSPAPVNAPGDSGGLFGGFDLFPILLLAGGALALWYLYTHRKRGSR